MPKPNLNSDNARTAKVAELTVFYGQSWIASMGPNKRQIEGTLFPETAFMFDDGFGTRGRAGELYEDIDVDFVPAREIAARTQSIQTAYLFRRAGWKVDTGSTDMILARSEGLSGASIKRLGLAPDMEKPFPYSMKNLDWALDSFAKTSKIKGLQPFIPHIVWCQGAADALTEYQDYHDRLDALLTTISDKTMTATGQSTRPMILVIQSPGIVRSGAWPNLQAQLDVIAKRDDCILAASGWAFPQYDRTHFTGVGAVMAGELVQLVAQAHAEGRDISTPYLTDYRREGRWVTAQVAGPFDLIVDTRIRTPRHQVAGEPVPNLGFDAYGASIRQVEARPREIRIELDESTGPVTVGHAWHRGPHRSRFAGTEANQSGNRGILRGDWFERCKFTKMPIHQWLASGYHEFKE